MPRTSRPWSLVVLLALLALLGPPAVASASDAGLKALVTQQRADEKTFEQRVETAAAALPAGLESARTAAQAARRVAASLDRLARLVRAVRRSYASYGPRFAAEAPETNESTVGRTLMIRGLRDGVAGARTLERDVRRAASAFRKVRTYPGLGRVSRRLERELGGSNPAGDRSEKRLKRGRTLIRTAPAPVPAA